MIFFVHSINSFSCCPLYIVYYKSLIIGNAKLTPDWHEAQFELWPVFGVHHFNITDKTHHPMTATSASPRWKNKKACLLKYLCCLLLAALLMLTNVGYSCVGVEALTWLVQISIAQASEATVFMILLQKMEIYIYICIKFWDIK